MEPDAPHQKLWNSKLAYKMFQDILFTKLIVSVLILVRTRINIEILLLPHTRDQQYWTHAYEYRIELDAERNRTLARSHFQNH